MSEYVKYINLGLIVFMGLTVLIRLFWGLRKGLILSAIRAAGTVAALIFTFMFYGTFFKLINPHLSQLLSDAMSSGQGAEIVADLPITKETLIVLIEGLAGPSTFLILFIGFNIIFGTVSLILRAVFKLLGKHKGFVSRLMGAGISVATGILFMSVLFMPFAGYTKKVPELYQAGAEVGLVSEEDAQLNEVVELLSQDYFMVDFFTVVSTPMFNFSSTVKTSDNVTVMAFDEVKNVLTLYPHLINLQQMDFSNIETIDFTPISQLVDGVGESEMLRSVVSEVFSVAAAKWLKGEEFLEINIKDLIAQSAPGMENMLDGVLQKLATCTKDNFDSVTAEFLSAAQTAVKTVAYVKQMSSISSSQDLTGLNEQLYGIFESLDESTVQMILPAVSKESIQAAGIDEQYATLVSTVLEDTLVAVCDMENEQIEKEAAAINNLAQYMSGTVEEPDPNAVIDALVSSEVILNTVDKLASDPSTSDSLLSGVNEEQKAAIKTAVDDYEANNPDAKAKLDIIRSLFGLDTAS